MLAILRQIRAASRGSMGQIGDQIRAQRPRIKGLLGMLASIIGHILPFQGVPRQSENSTGHRIYCFIMKQDPALLRDQVWQQSTATGDHRNAAGEGFAGGSAGPIGARHEKKQQVKAAQLLRVEIGVDVAGKADPLAEPGLLCGDPRHLILVSSAAEDHQLQPRILCCGGSERLDQLGKSSMPLHPSDDADHHRCISISREAWISGGSEALQIDGRGGDPGAAL